MIKGAAALGGGVFGVGLGVFAGLGGLMQQPVEGAADPPRSGSRPGPRTNGGRYSFAMTPNDAPWRGRGPRGRADGHRFPYSVLVGAAGARCAARIRQPGDAHPVAP